MLKTLLEEHRFVVNTETRAEAAIAELQKDGHELVISDFKMPTMDGAHFLQKAREVNPDLPFILVSGLMNTPELVKVANMGVTLVIEKPIDVDDFIEQVKRFVTPLSEAEFTAYKQVDQPLSPESTPPNESKKLELTYPNNLAYLSGFSPVMQHFLQNLWQEVEAEAHLCVSFFPGAEIELVLRELAVWKQQPAHSVTLLPAALVGTAAFSEKVDAALLDSPSGGIVGICGFAAVDHEQQKILLDFILAPKSMYPQYESITFVYVIEEHLLQNPTPDYNEDVLNALQKKACLLPPLCDRLTDLGYYIRKYLDLIAQKENMAHRAEVESDAVDLLLSYSWPRNFVELITILRRVVLLGHDGPLTADAIAVILKRAGATVPDYNPGNNLETYLRGKQSEYLLELLQQNACDIPTLCEKIGVDAITANGAKSVNDLSFLFPDLLHNTNLQ